MWHIEICIVSLFFYKLPGLKKKLEFQLVLLASSSHILLACDNFLLALVNDFVG